MAFSFIMSFFCLIYLDKKMKISLGPYVNSEVERLTSNIVNKAVREKMKEQKIDSFIIKEESLEKDNNISYDIEKLNTVKEEVTDYIQNILNHLDEADIKDYHLYNQLHVGKFKNIKNGILAENSISSLRGSILFGNIGPTVPVRLYYVGQVHSEINIDAKEYGINNVLVKIFIIISVKEQVIMPLSSSTKEIIIKELLGADIIQGTIPNYYTGFSKE